MRHRAPLLAAVLALAPLATVPAEATVPVQMTTVRNVYVPSEVYVVAGFSLEFTNVDIEGHDVYSLDLGPNGPLFSTGPVGTGGHKTVQDVDTLPPGVYPFVCSFHSEMYGNLNVVAQEG